MSQENEHSRYSVSIFIGNELIPLPTSCVTELYFVESIFSSNMYGKLAFIDFQRIFADKVFSGNELIWISYGAEQTYNKVFCAYEFKKYSSFQSMDRNGDGAFEILFIDTKYYLYTHQQISYSWLGKRNDEIIKDMFLFYNSEDEIGTWEEMSEDESVMIADTNDKMVTSGNSSEYLYYSPYWTFKENLRYILGRSSSKCEDGQNRAGLLFYPYTDYVDDNIQVKYNLVNLYTLLNQRTLMKVNEGDDGIYAISAVGEYDYRKVLDWDVKFYKGEDLKIIRGGKLIGFNPITKEHIEREYTYKDMINITPVLGEYSLFSDISNNKSFINITTATNTNVLDNIFYQMWLKLYCQQLKFDITVHGHEKRKAGGMIKLMWSFTKKDENQNDTYADAETSKKLSGGYLIASITNYFDNKAPGFYQKMTLIKNGLNDKGSTDLFQQSNINLVNNIDNEFVAGLSPCTDMGRGETKFSTALSEVKDDRGFLDKAADTIKNIFSW